MGTAGTTVDQHNLMEARLSRAQPVHLTVLFACFDCSIRMIVLLEYVDVQKLYGRNGQVMAVLSSQCGLLVGKWPMGPLNYTLHTYINPFH